MGGACRSTEAPGLLPFKKVDFQSLLGKSGSDTPGLLGGGGFWGVSRKEEKAGGDVFVVTRREEKAAALASASASWQGERAAKVCLHGRRIRPRFALASMGGGCGCRSQLKEMTPEDSGGIKS